ncbi:IclR family transcriptional regulator [Sedimentitalea nanhaiensis]|uniref:Transcriptional regulator, IclR family n=1 Tax=Sedimentitalea nanhaiensis TaxID=999627 RepID=A0A1I7EAZ4_9RHOB|nr:IclR family transcriptional regulator [Sedimentitalea nanhaiensis]SFU21126.1 transcriptional regulator, IclR family [Sedimentitalea nanhaiensis]
MIPTPDKVSTAYSVPPVERALNLLRYIGNGKKCRNLSTASKELGINRTTLIRLIHTLADNRMIEEIEEGAGYRLGPGLISLAAQAIHGRDIVQVCQPILAELTKATGMSSHLGILDGPEIVYLSRETPNSHLVSNVRAGSRLPAHASSIGRAILAELSVSELTEHFATTELTPRTDKTPVTLEAVLEQARADKAAGFAWSEGNYENGIGSCAAVVFDRNGHVAGALNVSGPQHLFAEETKAGDGAVRTAVLNAAKQASLGLGYGGDQY